MGFSFSGLVGKVNRCLGFRRRRLFVLLVFASVTLVPPSRAQCVDGRQSTLIDRDWSFHRGDETGAESPSFGDSSWDRVNLPHSFSTPYFLASNFYSGYGWYRKTLKMSCLSQDRRFSLEFDGVFRVAEVFVNGHKVGVHKGGYTGFTFDITSMLVPGKNVLAIRVNNLWNARLNPRAGEHVFSGGIYRHVRLVQTQALHVAWYGTYVTTPDLNEVQGFVNVATELQNDGDPSAAFVLRTEVLDPAGRTVQEVRSTERLSGNSSMNIVQQTPPIQHPRLWSPDTPVLYKVVTTILRSGRVVDRFETPFGFRWFKWTAEQGFFLNGEHLYFHGANVHQDHAGWGDAVSDDGVALDIGLIKQAGMNFIRGSHYPHSPVFADECDRQGVLLWSENSFWGIGGSHAEGVWTASAYPPHEDDQKPFEESVETSLQEMIRINRNHPSIVAWSMGNEVFFSDDDLLPKIRTLLHTLVELAHKADPSRPAGIGGVQRGDLDHIGDIAGYNGDGARLFIDPGIPNFVSEYGSSNSVRPGTYQPGFGELTGQPQYAWRGGQAIWAGFDHGSIVPSLSNLGMIDYFRLPKRTWYWYRNSYAHVPPPEWPEPGTPAALQLRSDKPAIRHADGRGSVQLVITVLGVDGKPISNGPPVQLEVISGSGEFPTGKSIEFGPASDIAIRDGEAAIEMRSYWSGPIHVRASSPGLKSADLVIQAEGAPEFTKKTALATPHPYVAQHSATPQYGPVMLAELDHPTEASSEVAGHEARFANDSSSLSFWQPRDNDHVPWWQVSFENQVEIDSVDVTFSGGRDLAYDIAVAGEGHGWTTLAHHAPGSGVVNLSGTDAQKRSAQSLRIVFANQTSIQMANVRVLGRSVRQ